MNLAAAWLVLRWLVRDTFRQSLTSGVFWLLFVASTVCILFCLSVRIHGTKTMLDPEQNAGALARLEVQESFLFGAVRRHRDGLSPDAVRELAYYVGGIGAQTVGLLLVLTLTAAFLPTFVDPNAALILLAKPVPRWFLFAGKLLGVLAFLAVHVTVFVLGTWTALGLVTGIWPAEYLWNIPILLLHFSVYFSFSALLAVTTRNTAVCVIGSVLFWLLCWAMNIGRHLLVAHDLEHFSELSRLLSEVSYWILPKPADLGALMYNVLHGDSLGASLADFARVQEKGAYHPGWSILASLAFPLAVLGIAGYELETADY